MILVDFSAVALSSVMVQLKSAETLDEDFIRHIVLNTIRSVRHRFHSEYGEVVICCDSPHSWRKAIFPYYKAARKKQREESSNDWTEIHRLLDLLQQEIDEHLPYKVVRVYGAEADDVIATIVQREAGPHLIVSNDKDFLQLYKLQDVAVYAPRQKKIVECESPERFLIEHILKGDMGDGIPNIFSDEDTFVVNKKQKRLTTKKLAELVSSVPKHVLKGRQLERYQQNEELISLFRIPEDLADRIWDAYSNKQVVGTRGNNLLYYFMEKKLRNLLQHIGHF